MYIPLKVPPAMTEGSFGWNAMHIKQLCQNKRDYQHFYNLYIYLFMIKCVYYNIAWIFGHLSHRKLTYFLSVKNSYEKNGEQLSTSFSILSAHQ